MHHATRAATSLHGDIGCISDVLNHLGHVLIGSDYAAATFAVSLVAAKFLMRRQGRSTTERSRLT